MSSARYRETENKRLDKLCNVQEGETHAERLDRLRQQSVPITALTSSQRRRQKRKLKAQSKQLRPAQKRCGKRQRAELKAQVFVSIQFSCAFTIWLTNTMFCVCRALLRNDVSSPLTQFVLRTGFANQLWRHICLPLCKLPNT